jgi:hypothetical protein
MEPKSSWEFLFGGNSKRWTLSSFQIRDYLPKSHCALRPFSVNLITPFLKTWEILPPKKQALHSRTAEFTGGEHWVVHFLIYLSISHLCRERGQDGGEVAEKTNVWLRSLSPLPIFLPSIVSTPYFSHQFSAAWPLELRNSTRALYPLNTGTN